MLSKKKISKLLAIAMLSMTISSIGMMTTYAAGNITDSYFDYTSMGSDNSNWTRPREKWDYTSCYIYNRNSDCAFKTQVWSVKMDYRGSAEAFEPLKNCSLEPYKQVNVWTSTYLKNMVKEWGYSHCSVKMFPNVSGTVNLRGCWSSDSI